MAITNIVLSVIALVFTIVAMSGWTDDCDQLATQNAWGWKGYEYQLPGNPVVGNFEVGVGLRGVAIKASYDNDGGVLTDECSFAKYKDDAGLTNFMSTDLQDDCKEAGEAAIGMTIIAFF